MNEASMAYALVHEGADWIWRLFNAEGDVIATGTAATASLAEQTVLMAMRACEALASRLG